MTEKQVPGDGLQEALQSICRGVSELPLNQREKTLLTQSYAAFQAAQPSAWEKGTAAMLSGGVVSDSESDDASEYVAVRSITDQSAQKILSKKRKAIARRNQRLNAKVTAEKNFLGCRRGRAVNSVEQKFPDIGKSIEHLGADAWRRTGVLTFNGNFRVKQKVTYKNIFRRSTYTSFHTELWYSCV